MAYWLALIGLLQALQHTYKTRNKNEVHGINKN